jgi:cell division protein WhiA
MSFTTEIKSEISQNELKPCCTRAQLSALIQLNATLVISNQSYQLIIKTENPTTAKRIWILLKERYQVTCELSIIKKMKLKKNNIYLIKVLSKVKEILEDVGLWSSLGLSDRPTRSIVAKDCCARAYLAGAFLASGSINNPTKTNYHCEIATHDEKHALFISKLMQRFELPAKVVPRRQQHVVYLKASDKISDFLRATGAIDALMKFEDIRIQRDFRNSLTRLDNCEVANEVKTLQAASRQLDDIIKIQKSGRFDSLEEKLKEIALLRIDNPDASLNELSDVYEEQTGTVMSKSGMKHRFNKLHEIASNVK